MIFFDIEEQSLTQIDVDLLQKAAKAVLEDQKCTQEVELTIALKSSQTLQELNKDFMGIDAPTDVLSFTANELDPETNNLYLGDIIISLEIAQSQAAAAGHSTSAELQLLVVHGLLHLLGHDHASALQKTEMWDAQKRILDAIECPLSQYPE